MKAVNIGALKARLSLHIDYVKKGEEVLVCERNVPVARIIPFEAADYPERERELIARGVLTPPRKRRDPNAKWPKPPGKISEKVAQELWDPERGVR